MLALTANNVETEEVLCICGIGHEALTMQAPAGKLLKAHSFQHTFRPGLAHQDCPCKPDMKHAGLSHRAA